MRKVKRLLFLGLFLLSATAAWLIAFEWLTPPTFRITEATYDAIQMDMSHEEVRSIIGCPPGDYYDKPNEPVPFTKRSEVTAGYPNNDDKYYGESWSDGTMSVHVVYHAGSGKVAAKELWVRGEPTLFAQFRKWLRL